MSDSPQTPRAIMVRNLVIMVVSVVILDAVAIGLFYLLHLNHEEGGRRQLFVAGWTLLSLLVVAVPLRRIRAARGAALRGGAPAGPPDGGPGGPRSGG